MTGELYMRHKGDNAWTDAYTAWGVSFEDGAVSTLMTLPTMKEDITNESRLEHGTRHMDISPKMAEREFALPMHIVADSKADYLAKHAAFSTFLSGGWVDIWLAANNSHSAPTAGDTIYHCKYRSCNQFRQYLQGIAVFALSLIEPDPSNRTL